MARFATQSVGRMETGRSGPRRVLLLLAFGILTAGCLYPDPRRKPPRPVDPAAARVVRLETTGYCACGHCTGWRRNWLGRPVLTYGPRKGQPKKIGQTASGVQARPGTLAADTSIFPFGTVMYVPGYGYGVVQDRGGAIKGMKLDLFFPRHNEALQWGRQVLDVLVWRPDA